MTEFTEGNEQEKTDRRREQQYQKKNNKGGDKNMSKIILTEEKDSLAERIFAFSEAGQKPLSKEDWKKIPTKYRQKAMEIYNILRSNEGKISSEEIEKVEGQTINISDLIENFHRQTEKEQGKTLSFLDDLRNKKEKIARKESLEELPNEIQVLLNLSQSEWDRLPANGQELILRKMYLLQMEEKKPPIIEGFDKLSKEKQEAILKSV